MNSRNEAELVPGNKFNKGYKNVQEARRGNESTIENNFKTLTLAGQVEGI